MFPSTADTVLLRRSTASALRNAVVRRLAALVVTAVVVAAPALSGARLVAQAPLIPHTITYAPGKSITLAMPRGLTVDVAATGLKRVRFLTMSPDNRVFATGMFNLADNTNGSVYILEGWDAATQRYTHVTHYLDHLRNPNNLAFYTEPASGGNPGAMWLYVPLTDKLVRYRYNPGDEAPSSEPEVLIRWPDYGLSYKYGGWHLTRTVAVANLHGHTRVYVATGSSCNYCQEREVARAAILSMNPDGSDQKVVAHGMRNAVDLRWVPEVDGGALFATNMGDDHLGDQLPEDTFFELDSNSHAGPIAAATAPNYGWPTCYFAHGKAVHDSTPLPTTSTENDPKVTSAQTPQVKAHRKANADSVYGYQQGVAAAGTNLAAGGGHADGVDPNAALGKPPAPLSDCSQVPAAYTTFAAHSSPLGMAYFDAKSPILGGTGGSFVVAQHGASHPHIGTGYRLVRFTAQDRTPKPLITGFLGGGITSAKVDGRPCGLLILGPDTFLLTDDYLGLVYIVHPVKAQ
ncbi:Glucose/arabinose dehydrogenase, beta-propeller fold [Bryocella elongata]|uniref:Glucose/arabinose dehydrogenase, beta-propeller fold n=2 Tax=Bryocella elongata TaxID=863522 RepID=A0A1H6C0X6_9BACT|nr:Glucose/arabinose dehydrogenase, beta-propeller fold [Bryocella elongata]